MDYRKIEIMKDDYLKIVKFIASDVFQWSIMKLALWIILVLHSMVTLITIYCFLYVMNRSEFICYATVFFSTFYAMLAMATLLFKNKIAATIKDDIAMWTIDSAGEKLHSRIRKEIILTTAFILANFILSICTGFLFVIPVFADNELFFAYRFFEEYLPEQKIILNWIYRATCPFLAYVMTVHNYQLIYYTQHMRFQIMMFLEHILRLADFHENRNEEELFYNQRYQNEVHRKLKFCIRRYDEFVATLNNKLKEMKYLIVGYAVCGCLAGLGIFLYIFSEKVYPEYYPRLAASSVTAVATFTALIYCGQALESQNDLIMLIATEISWYNFDKSNKNTYNIFLMNVMKPKKFRFSDNYSVNYKLGLTILKGIYSVMSVVVKIRSSS